jgi:four helix bundle protein
MRVDFVEDLQVFQRARGLTAAVIALAPSLRSQRWLWEQVASSAESVVSNISEGFAQASDRAVARYLVIATGSAEEVRVHVRTAESMGLVSPEQAEVLADEARQIANMLRGLIRYLRQCGRRERNP